jgi:hypothetical protein
MTTRTTLASDDGEDAARMALLRGFLPGIGQHQSALDARMRALGDRIALELGQAMGLGDGDQ